VTGRLSWTDFEEISIVLTVYRNIDTTGRGSADEVVVVVKLETCENTVTYLRIKSLGSKRELGGEGLHMRTVCKPLSGTPILRLAKGTKLQLARICWPRTTRELTKR
jgi:hypothetical protein